MQLCLVEGRKPCSACQEDIELKRMIEGLQEKRRILRTQMNAIHDPFNFKFPPEIASLIFSLSMGDEDYEPHQSTLRKLPTPFILGSVNQRWRQLARSTPPALDNALIYSRETDKDSSTSGHKRLVTAIRQPTTVHLDFLLQPGTTHLARNM